MEDKVTQLENRLNEVEKRLAKLEGPRKGPVTSPVVPSVHPDTAYRSGKVFPFHAVILIIVGGLILWNSLPRILSTFLGYGYGYGRGLDSFNLIMILLGSVLLSLGITFFVQYKNAPEEVSQSDAKISLKKVQAVPAVSTEAGSENLEFKVAANWFGIVGVIAIVLAVVFFLKFAFDNGLIGPTGQVAIGIFFGICLIAGGEFFRSRYEKYSQFLTGGGIVVLYVSLWASFSLFHLVSAYVALSSAFLVTIVAALLSIRYNAMYIAGLGILGGFSAPILLVKGFESQLLLFSYVVILNLGVLTIAAFKDWQKLNIVSFISTYVIFASWYANFYKSEKFVLTISILTVLFLIYSVIWFIYNVNNQKKAKETDILLMLLNAAVYFGFGYVLLKPSYEFTLGFFAFGLAVFYFVLGYIAFARYKEDSYLSLGFLGISIVFLTLAVPLQVKKNLITIVWAIEALVLLWVGFWLLSYRLRMAAFAVYILVAIRLIGFDTRFTVEGFNLILNLRFLTFVLSVVSAGAAAWIYNLYKAKITKDELPLQPILLIAASVAFIWALSWESISYFDLKIRKIREGDVKVLSFQRHAQVTIPNFYYGNPSAAPGFPFQSTSSATQSGGSLSLRINIVNEQGTNPYKNFLSGATVRLTDTSGNGVVVQKISPASGQVIFENIPPGRYGLLAYKAGYKGVWKQDGGGVGSGCTNPSYGGSTSNVSIKNATSNFLDAAWDNDITIVAGQTTYCRDLGLAKISPTTGVQQGRSTYSPIPNTRNVPVQSLSSQQQAEIRKLESARDVSLSIIWIAYAIVLISLGIIKKYKPIRLFAMAFFAMTILKVFLFDSRNLQMGYRIVAFMVLGTILLTVSLLYQKYKNQIGEFLLND